MGMPRIGADPWTAVMVRAFPNDGNRYEVIDGELLVTPSPTWDHQGVVEELFIRLRPWTEQHGVGVTKLSPANIQLEPAGLVQPDLFVVPPNDDGTKPRAWRDITRPVLAVRDRCAVVLPRGTRRVAPASSAVRGRRLTVNG